MRSVKAEQAAVMFQDDFLILFVPPFIKIRQILIKENQIVYITVTALRFLHRRHNYLEWQVLIFLFFLSDCKCEQLRE